MTNEFITLSHKYWLFYWKQYVQEPNPTTQLLLNVPTLSLCIPQRSLKLLTSTVRVRTRSEPKCEMSSYFAALEVLNNLDDDRSSSLELFKFELKLKNKCFGSNIPLRKMDKMLVDLVQTWTCNLKTLVHTLSMAPLQNPLLDKKLSWREDVDVATWLLLLFVAMRTQTGGIDKQDRVA